MLSRFHIDHELELGRLFDAEFGELGAPSRILSTKEINSVRVSRTPPIALAAWIAEERLDEVLAASPSCHELYGLGMLLVLRGEGLPNNPGVGLGPLWVNAGGR